MVTGSSWPSSTEPDGWSPGPRSGLFVIFYHYLFFLLIFRSIPDGTQVLLVQYPGHNDTNLAVGSLHARDLACKLTYALLRRVQACGADELIWNQNRFAINYGRGDSLGKASAKRSEDGRNMVKTDDSLGVARRAKTDAGQTHLKKF